MDLHCEGPIEPDLPARLYSLTSMRWQRAQAVGLGEACRAAGDDGTLATAVVVDGVPIHVSESTPTIN